MACSSKWLDVFVSSEEEKDGKDDEFVCSVQSGRWLPERRYKVTYEAGNGQSTMTVPIVMNESIRYIRDSGVFSSSGNQNMTNNNNTQTLRWKLKREYTRSFHEGSLVATQKKLDYTTDVSVQYNALPSISELKTTQSFFWARRYKYSVTGDDSAGRIATTTYVTFPIKRERNYVPYGHFEAKCSDGPWGKALKDFINGRNINMRNTGSSMDATFNYSLMNQNHSNPLFVYQGAGYFEFNTGGSLPIYDSDPDKITSFFKMSRSNFFITNATSMHTLQRNDHRTLDGGVADLRYHKIAIKSDAGEWWVPVAVKLPGWEADLGSTFIYDKSKAHTIDSSEPFIIEASLLVAPGAPIAGTSSNRHTYTFMKYVETEYAKNSGTGTYVGGWSDSQWIYKGLDFYVVDNVYGYGGTTSLVNREFTNVANFNKSERDVSLFMLGTDEENRGSYFHSGASSTFSSRNYNSSTLSKPPTVEDYPTPPAGITDYIYQDIKLNWGVYFQIGGTYTGSDPNALKSVLFQFKAAETFDDAKFVAYKNGLETFINDSSVKIDGDSSYTNSGGTAHLDIYLYKDDGSGYASLVSTLNAVSHSNHNYGGVTAASVDWTNVADLGWRIPYVTSAQFMTPHSLPARSVFSNGFAGQIMFEHTLSTAELQASITNRTMGTKSTDASNKSFTTADYIARTTTDATTNEAGIRYGEGSTYDFTQTGSALPTGHVRNSINACKSNNTPAKYSVDIEVAGADWIDLGGNKNSSASDWANATSSSTYRGTELSSLAMDFLPYDTGIVSYDSSTQLVTPSINIAGSHQPTVNRSSFASSNGFLQADKPKVSSNYAENFLIAEGNYVTVTEADVGIDFTKSSLVDYSAQNIRKYTFNHNRGDVKIGKYKEGSSYREFNVSNKKLKDLEFPANWVGSKTAIDGKYSDWQYFMTEVELIHSRFESADPYSAGTDYPRIISVGSNYRNSLANGRSYIVNPQSWNNNNGDSVKWIVNRRDSFTLASNWNSHSPDTRMQLLSTGGSSSINTSWKYGQLPFHEDKYEFVVTKTTETNRNWETIADSTASTQKVTTLWDPMIYVIVATDTDIRDSSTLAVPQSVINSFISAIPLPTGISSIPAGNVTIQTEVGSTKQHQIILRVDGWIKADGTTVSTECFMDHAYFALRGKLRTSSDFNTHLSSSFGTATQDPSFVKRYFPTNHSEMLPSSIADPITFGTGAAKTADFYSQFTNRHTYDLYGVGVTVPIPTTKALQKKGITYPIHFYESGRGNKAELLRQDFTVNVASARPSVTRASKQLYHVTVNYRDADNNAGGYRGDITSVNPSIRWHWLQTMTVFMQATGTISDWLTSGVGDAYGNTSAITFVNREEWNPSSQTATSYTANWSVLPYYTTVVKVSPNTTTNTTWYDTKSSVDSQLRLVTTNFQHLKVLTTYNALQLTGPNINTATTNWDSSSPSPSDTFSGNNISDTYYDDVNVVYQYEDTTDIKSILNPLFTNANHLLIPAVEYKLYVQDASALTASQLANIRSSLMIALFNVNNSIADSDYTITLDEIQTSNDPSFSVVYLIYTLRSTEEAKIRKVYQAMTKTDANGALVLDVWTVYDGLTGGSNSSGISSSTPSQTFFKFKLDKVYNAQPNFSVLPSTAAAFQDVSLIPTTSAYLSEGYTKKTVLIGGFPVQSSNTAFDNVSWANRPEKSSGELLENASYNASTYGLPSYVITETYTSGASSQYESLFSANESIRETPKSGMFVKIDTLKLGTFGLSKLNRKYSSWDTFSITTPSGLQAADVGGKEGSGSVYNWSNVPSNSGNKMKKEFLGFAWPGQDLHIGPYGPNVPIDFSNVDAKYLALTPNVTISDVSAIGDNGIVIEEQGKFVIEETNSNWLIPTWTKDYESSNFTFPIQVGDMIRVGTNDHKGASTEYCRVMEIREAEYIVNGTSGNLMIATDGGTLTTYPATSANSAHIEELASTAYYQPVFPTDCLKTGQTRATYRGNVTGDGSKHASAQKQTLTSAGGDPGAGAVLNDALAVYTENGAQVQYNYEGHLSNHSARAIAKTGIARYCIRIDMSINATTIPRENMSDSSNADHGTKKDLRQWVNTDDGSDTPGTLFNRHLLSSGIGQGLNNYERYFYPMYKMKMIPRTVTARLDNGIKSIKELVLVGYSLTPHTHREEHGHEVSREQLILLRLNEVDGSIVSNSAQAKGVLAVLFRDEKGGKNFDYDNGIIRVPVNGAVRNLTFTATDIDGKPAKIGRLNLWLKLHVNF